MSGRILIVEDNIINLEMIRELLLDEGYDILAAREGREALQIIDKEKVDLVLLDIMMPGMDGFEVCKKIKFDMERVEIPVIMVTALNAREDRLKGLEAGADDFLTKPIDFTELKARVRSALRLKEAYDRIEEQYNRLEYQLDLARGVQQSLTWVHLPADLEGEIFYHPVEKVGGDLYDLVSLGENKYGFFIADSSGHGVPAALIMVMVKLIFSDINKEELSPAEVLREINCRLNDFFGEQLQSHFVTAVYLIVDRNKKTIEWANGGHPYPILINAEGEWLKLKDISPPLGIMDEIEYENNKINYSNYFRLFLYTDGLIDLFDSEKYSFSEEKMMEIVPDLIAKEIDGKSQFYHNLLEKVKDETNDDICYCLFNI